MKVYSFLYISLITFIMLVVSGCKKLIEIEPPLTSIGRTNVYTTDATAISVLTGMYINLSKGSAQGGDFSCGILGLSVLCGLSGDELTLFEGVNDAKYLAYYKNALIVNSSQTYGSDAWIDTYRAIFACNEAIEGLNVTATLSPAVHQQLLGEALFLRAYYYFQLVNLYGALPLLVTTDFKIYEKVGRSSTKEVYMVKSS